MHLSKQQKIFRIFNCVILSILCLSCILPFLNLLAISFSSSPQVAAGNVSFWPEDFTLKSYKFVLSKSEFYRAFFISVMKVLVGVPVNMLITLLVAYPLSKTKTEFRSRNFYMWFFVITMVFSGGLVPWYIIISKLHLIDSFWALILPVAVPVYNIVMLTNAFKDVPKGLEEAALMDGASPMTILFRIYTPLCKAMLATLVLFSIVSHWNSWFEGLILMNRPDNYPLQSYLQTVVVNRDVTLMSNSDMQYFNVVSDRTSKAAQMFVATLPVIIVYPFLQKYFTTGATVGAVKE